jgi:hypothetical protein
MDLLAEGFAGNNRNFHSHWKQAFAWLMAFRNGIERDIPIDPMTRLVCFPNMDSLGVVLIIQGAGRRLPPESLIANFCNECGFDWRSS